jgi:hypothetical protein
VSKHVDIVAWGVETGRYSPARAAFWAKAAEDERRRTGSASQTEAAIRSLHPVYEVPQAQTGRASVWTDDGSGHPVLASGTAPGAEDFSETPLLDELDRAVFGPSQDERYRAEDLAAEAALAEAIERERNEARGGLTEAEERALFGDGPG